MKLNKSTIMILAVLGVIALCTGFVVASYIFPASNPVPIEVVPTPTPVPTPTTVTTVLSADVTSVLSGGSVTLTATMAEPLTGIVVNFFDGTNQIGSATTVNGIASLTVTPPAAEWPNSVIHTYTAQPVAP